MQLDPENPIVKLCAKGMDMEGHPDVAKSIFQQAWNEALTNEEKFIAAHYVARHQNSISDKLKWDKVALELALEINDDNAKKALPSLYLNVAKCYEDLSDFESAKENYHLGLSFTGQLEEDGYGKLIKNGLENGLKRIS